MSGERESFDATLTELLAADHDYSSSAEAAATAMVEAFNFMASELGLTGFQGSWAALTAYGRLMRIDGPFLVIKAEDALYPQYDLPGRLAEFLANAAPWLSEQATTKLAESNPDFVNPRVRAHWEVLAAADPARPAALPSDPEGVKG